MATISDDPSIGAGYGNDAAMEGGPSIDSVTMDVDPTASTIDESIVQPVAETAILQPVADPPIDA